MKTFPLSEETEETIDISSDEESMNLDYREEKIMDVTRVLGLNGEKLPQKWLNQIDFHQKHILSMRTLTNPNIREWFEYLYNESDPEHSKYRCGVCSRYAGQYSLSGQLKKSPIAQEEGTLSNTTENNRNILNRHASNHVHKLLLHRMKTLKRGEEITGQELIQPTILLIRSVYTLVLMNTPLTNIMFMGDFNRVESRTHYNLPGATKVLNVIHEYLKKELLQSLKISNAPISLIMDTATDNTNKNYLNAYFSTVINQEKKIIFYKLIDLEGMSTAEYIFAKLIENFEIDGILELMKQNIFSIVTDGASVFTAIKNSVGTKLSLWTGRNDTFIRIWCYSHRLQVILGKSYQKFDAISEMNDFMGDISTFYSSSYKRQASLTKLGNLISEKTYKLNNVFRIRWISSSYIAVKNIVKSYKPLVLNLKKISNSQDFDKKTKTTANNLVGLVSKTETIYYLCQCS